ncbi:hypothetical protein RhiirA1_503177, partial [Rhizophagus irregularis]
MTVHLQGSDSELAKPISIFLFRTLRTLLGREHKLLNIDVGVNEIRLELMLGYYVSIDNLDETLVWSVGISTETPTISHCKTKQSDKEKAELIAELNRDVGKIKQEQIAINVSVQDGTSVVKSPTRSELQVTSQSSISPPIEGNSENSSDVTQPTHAGSKLLEDRQTDEFLISVNEDDVQVIDGNQELTTDMTIEVKLVHLFLEVSIEGKNTTQARQKEISCRYSYGKSRGVHHVLFVMESMGIMDYMAHDTLPISYVTDNETQTDNTVLKHVHEAEINSWVIVLQEQLLKYNKETFDRFMQNLTREHEKRIKENNQLRQEISNMKAQVQGIEKALAIMKSSGFN